MAGCKTAGWTEYTADLSALRGQTIVLRFRSRDDGVADTATHFSVDNVVINNRVDDYEASLTAHPQVLTAAFTDLNGLQRFAFSAEDYETLWDAAAFLEETGALPEPDP